MNGEGRIGRLQAVTSTAASGSMLILLRTREMRRAAPLHLKPHVV